MRSITHLSLFAVLALAAVLPVLADAPTAVPGALPDGSTVQLTIPSPAGTTTPRAFPDDTTVELSFPTAEKTTSAKPTFMDVLTGKVVPLSLKLKDMATGWIIFTCESSSNPFSSLMLQTSGHPLLSGISALYSRGQTIELAGETFLITYGRSNVPFTQMMMYQQEEQNDQMAQFKLTPDTEVAIQLLNVRTIGNIKDIHPFDKQEITSMNALIDQEQLKTQEATSLNKLRQLAVATQMYSQDNNGKLPPCDSLKHFQQTIVTYLGNDPKTLLQSGTSIPYQVNLALNSHKEGDFKKPAEVVVVFEAQPGLDGKRGVGFLDGHAQYVTETEWTKLQATVKMK